MTFQLGRTYVVLSQQKVPCAVIKTKTQKELLLLERIQKLPAFVYERKTTRVRFTRL